MYYTQYSRWIESLQIEAKDTLWYIQEVLNCIEDVPEMLTEAWEDYEDGIIPVPELFFTNVALSCFNYKTIQPDVVTGLQSTVRVSETPLSLLPGEKGAYLYTITEVITDGRIMSSDVALSATAHEMEESMFQAISNDYFASSTGISITTTVAYDLDKKELTHIGTVSKTLGGVDMKDSKWKRMYGDIEVSAALTPYFLAPTSAPVTAMLLKELNLV